MKKTTLENIKTWRRHIHCNPELSSKEYKTAEYIRKELDRMGLQYEIPMETATVVFIDAGADRSILLRADIDALPINEENNMEFRSKNPGVMHACGHDAHTAMLLGALNEIVEMKKENLLNVDVCAVFQPAEESQGGADVLVESYDFGKFNIKEAYALHVNPDYDEGTIISRNGPIMASCNEFFIDIKGRSAHVGMREKGLNAINASILVYNQLQTIPEYSLDANHTNIVHVGVMNTGEVMNSVPANGHMEGTIRTYDMNDLEIIKKRMEDICSGVAVCTGCQVNLRFSPGYPAVINRESLVEKAEAAAEKAGALFILKEEPYLLGEDFSFFSDVCPINFSFVGIRNEKLGYTSGLHTPTLNMRDEALVYGVDYLTEIVRSSGI